MLLSASLSAQPAPDSAANASPRTARVEGQVLSHAGEPLRKATLRLTHDADRDSKAVFYTDTSDATGKFVFEDVLPGRYTLSAERSGFLRQNYGARGATPGSPGVVLTLAAGQIMKDLEFKLLSQGVIAGRVTDADGDPMPGLTIWVSYLTHFRGQRQLSLVGNPAKTDDQGSFRIAGLSPGMYYVSADDTDSRVGSPDNAVRPSRALNRARNVTTYYPDSVDAAGATTLHIVAGSELRGIDIRMRQERVFSIRGLTTDAATGKPATAFVVARLKNSSQPGFDLPWQTSSREDGTFEFQNLLPGEYALMASTNNLSSSNNPAEPTSGREEVSISDSDVTGVKLTLAKGATIAGTLKLEGGGPPGRPTIFLVGLEGGAFGTDSNAQTKDDGTFEMHGVLPAKYRAFLQGLPEGVYVKSIRFGQQDFTHATLDLTSGVSGSLDILLSPRAAEVSGTVRNQDGAAVTGVEILLWSKQSLPENLWGGPHSAATDQNGDFRIAGLAPGDYYLAAWEDIEADLTSDPDFLQRFTSQATVLTLEEGAHQTAQPNLISREAVTTAAAKLP